MTKTKFYTAIPYRASTGPEQGFPCVVFPHREKPVFITGFPDDENRFFPVGNTTLGKPCFHYRDGFTVYILLLGTIFNTFFFLWSTSQNNCDSICQKIFLQQCVLSIFFLSCHTMAEIAKLLFNNYIVFFLPRIFNKPYADHYKPPLDYKSLLNTNCTLVEKFKGKKAP